MLFSKKFTNLIVQRFSYILILLGVVLFTSKSLGEVDPAWLKNWNQAQKSRPVTLTSNGNIATEKEPGIPLIIHGQIYNPDGSPASEVVVLAYHRDHDGFEFGNNDNSLATWKLQGWVKTDSDGGFEFKTIRAAPDHLGREGAHIHFTLESSDFGRQWAPSFFFSDDPMLTSKQRRQSKKAGKFGRVRVVETIDNVQHIDVNIQLKEQADF